MDSNRMGAGPISMGEMAGRIRAFDWSATPLGPIERWSPALRAIVDMLLAHGFPMVLLWGPELIQIYNDGYRQVLGDRHPGGLGQPTFACWPETVDVAGPLLARARAGETVTLENARFPVARTGAVETAWFTVTFSPVLTDEAPGGVLVTPLDTTARVLADEARDAALASLREGEKRQAFLLRLSDALRPLSDPIAIQATAMRVLGADLGVNRAFYGEAADDGDTLVIGPGYSRDTFPLEGQVRFSDFELDMAAWYRSGRTYVIEDTQEDARYGETTKEGFRAIAVGGAVGVPLVKDGRVRAIVSLHQSVPRRWTTTEISLLEDTAERTWAAVERARAEARLRASEERQVFLLKLSDALRPVGDPVEIQRAATRMLGERLKASRVFYVMVAGDGDTSSILGDYTDGVPSRVGRYSLSAFSSYAVREWCAGRTASSSDVNVDPRYGETERAAYASVSTRAGFGIPLLKEGRLVALLGVNQSSPRHWTPDDVDLARETAERTWAAVERARAEAALRESEERQAFLLAFSDALRLLSDPVQVQHAAMKLLAERLDVMRASYFEVDADQDGFTLKARHERDPVPIPDRMRLSDFSPTMAAAYRRGRPLVIRDTEVEAGEGSQREAYRAIGIRAWTAVPLLKDGLLISIVGVHSTTPRDWTDAEVGLIEDVAERTWSAVERAHAEAALQESEARFAQFAASSSDALWIRDAHSLEMEYVSPAIEPIYGVPPGALLDGTQNWTALILPEDRAAALSHLEQARGGKAIVHEFRIRRPSDGAVRWIRDTDFPLHDARGRVQRIGGIAQDVTGARLAAERQGVLVAELQHRTRNLIAVVKGIANDTMRETGPTQAFRAAFADRLSALSRVQGLLSRSDAEPITFRSLLRLELDALGAGTAGDRVTVDGPEVFLRPSTVQTLALALHELATNARKHGALSHADGRLAVTWRKHSEDGERRLAIAWTETGLERAPDRSASEREGGGYGRELIEHALPHALGARTSYALSASGVRCTIDLAVRRGKGGP